MKIVQHELDRLSAIRQRSLEAAGRLAHPSEHTGHAFTRRTITVRHYCASQKPRQHFMCYVFFSLFLSPRISLRCAQLRRLCMTISAVPNFRVPNFRVDDAMVIQVQFNNHVRRAPENYDTPFLGGRPEHAGCAGSSRRCFCTLPWQHQGKHRLHRCG